MLLCNAKKTVAAYRVALQCGVSLWRTISSAKPHEKYSQRNIFDHVINSLCKFLIRYSNKIPVTQSIRSVTDLDMLGQKRFRCFFVAYNFISHNLKLGLNNLLHH